MIGERSLRKEDSRLLSGRGRYLADHDEPGLLHMAMVRSPHPHARVAGIDTAEADSHPGVVAVLTQDDLDKAGARRMSHLLPISGIKALEWGLLATDRVRFAGEAVAAVIATSRAVAEDAVELVAVAYEPMPAVVDAFTALEDGAELLYPQWGTNAFLTLASPPEATDAALATAPHVLTDRIEHHRIHALPLEGHGIQASTDPVTGGLLVIASQQQPHQLRTVIAEVVAMSESEVRVVSPDMGGGFGNKQHFTREECLVAMVAKMLARPVRWSEDRTEGLGASIHSRDQVHEIEVGYDDSGKVLAYRVRITTNLGNPVLYFSGVAPSMVTIGSLSGGYDFGPVSFELRAVATNTCPLGAYRGFGQPQAHVSTERILDSIAVALGIDPIAVRRRNLLPDTPRPWISAGGSRLDIGPLGSHLDQLVEEFGYESWRERQAWLRAEGRLVGIGISTLVQGTAPSQYGIAGRFGSWETAAVSVLPDGTVNVQVGTKSQGQAHETVLAQVVASALGVDMGAVTVRDGDTSALPYGMGTWGSRSAVMGGGAVLTAATRIGEKMALIGAGLAERLGRPPRFEEIAEEAWWHTHRLPHGIEAGLTASAVYSPGHTKPEPGEDGLTNFDETFGAHMLAVAVEVDPGTGDISVLDAVVVSDCGTVINPMVVEGQHQGAWAQGLGAVLLEEIAYSSDGHLLSSTLHEYLAPEAGDVARLRVVHRETPSDTAGGFRGVGEAGIITTPAAMCGAVADALEPLGVTIHSTRLHAHHIRALLRHADHHVDPAAFAKG